MITHAYNPGTWGLEAGELEVQITFGYLFEGILACMKPCHKRTEKEKEKTQWYKVSE